MRHPPRGVAASGFPPLCNIPHCCLPQESGPCLSTSVADHPLKSATRHRLGRLLPCQLPDGIQSDLAAESISQLNLCLKGVSSINHRFQWLSQSARYINYILLTRAPLVSIPKNLLPFDLHVLSTPPAFTLSQDQTLHNWSVSEVYPQGATQIPLPMLTLSFAQREAQSTSGFYFLLIELYSLLTFMKR